MIENYEKSALRHYRDAEHLAAAGQFDNAGHLIGFAAECAIKHSFKISTGGDETPRSHLPGLATAMRTRFSGRNVRQAPMRTLLGVSGSSYFENWSVASRYSDDGTVTAETFAVWRGLARRTLGAAGLRLASNGDRT